MKIIELNWTIQSILANQGMELKLLREYIVRQDTSKILWRQRTCYRQRRLMKGAQAGTITSSCKYKVAEDPSLTKRSKENIHYTSM